VDRAAISAYLGALISTDNSFTLGDFSQFAVSQHMFDVYDGPAFASLSPDKSV
jgi:hypothetical protein